MITKFGCLKELMDRLAPPKNKLPLISENWRRRFTLLPQQLVNRPYPQHRQTASRFSVGIETAMAIKSKST